MTEADSYCKSFQDDENYKNNNSSKDIVGAVVVPSISDLLRLDCLPPDLSVTDSIFLLSSCIPSNCRKDDTVKVPDATAVQIATPNSSSETLLPKDHTQQPPLQNGIVLLSETSQILKCGEQINHQISTIDSKISGNERHFSSIVVSIIFRGSYITTTDSRENDHISLSVVSLYKPGRLTASLLSFEELMDCIENDIDYPELEQCNNSSDTLGKLVLRYRPKTNLLPCSILGRIIDNRAKFVVQVKGFAAPYTQYSINAFAVEECFTIDRVVRELSFFIQSQKELDIKCQQEDTFLIEEEALERRKLTLLKCNLLADCQSQILRCESDMKTKISGSSSGGKASVSLSNREELKAMGMEYVYWCRLIALRTQESNNTKFSIRNLISRHNAVQEEKLAIQIALDKASLELSRVESFIAMHNRHNEAAAKVTDDAVKSIVTTSNDNRFRSSDTTVLEIRKWDPYLALSTRARPPSQWSLKDREWVTVDRILNPQLWDKQKRFSSIARLDLSEEDVNDDNRGSLGALIMSPIPTPSVKTDMTSNNTTAKLIRRQRPLGKWKCPFTDRNELIAIWSKVNVDSMTLDEKRCYQLLIEYNGSYTSSYSSSNDKKPQKHRLLHDNKWDFHSNDKLSSRSIISLVDCDLHQRSRLLWRDLNKSMKTSTAFMECSLLHTMPQRFPTQILRLELERELDRVLLELLYNKEKKAAFSLFHDTSIARSDAGSNQADDNFKPTKKNPQKIADWKVDMGKSAVDSRACRACKQMPCRWKPFVHMEEVNRRRNELLKELVLVQKQANLTLLDSKVARSARNGGASKIKRTDLLQELQSEIADLERRIRFERVDKELHDSLASEDAFVEIETLHGYKTLLSTNYAVVALEQEHNKLAGNSIAKDIIDGILNWFVYYKQFSMLLVMLTILHIFQDKPPPCSHDFVPLAKDARRLVFRGVVELCDLI